MTEEAKRGDVYSQSHYDLAKNLDHSCWQKGAQACWDSTANRLPRLVTPSDVDSVFGRMLHTPQSVPFGFDDRGSVILGELSSSKQDWRLVDTGQFRFYGALLNGPHCAVLCRHNITPEHGKRICTRHDIVSFQAMVWDHGPVFDVTRESNAQWQQFVFSWYENAQRVRRRIIGYSVGLNLLSVVT